MVLTQFAIGFLVGLTLLVITPVAARGRAVADRIGNIYAAVAMQTVDSPAITVGSHADMALRARVFDATMDSQKIVAHGLEKPVRMTPDTTLRWGDRPFTFVDERYGVTCDLRDVAVLDRINRHIHDGVMKTVEYVKDRDGEIVDVNGYVRAVVAVAPDGPLAMDFNETLRPQIDGNEDAGAWDRVWEGVRRMFLPYQDPLPMLKLALPVLAFIGAMFAGYYIFGPGTLPGGSSTRTVSVGASSLLPWLTVGGGGDE